MYYFYMRQSRKNDFFVHLVWKHALYVQPFNIMFLLLYNNTTRNRIFLFAYISAVYWQSMNVCSCVNMTWSHLIWQGKWLFASFYSLLFRVCRSSRFLFPIVAFSWKLNMNLILLWVMLMDSYILYMRECAMEANWIALILHIKWSSTINFIIIVKL